MKWINDMLAESVMQQMGLKWVVETISEGQIDIKKSRQNTARQTRLIGEHAEAIAKSILKGAPIPFIVVRKTKSGEYVIAGGNHRDQACRITGEQQRTCYVVECTDGEFTVLCRLLNTVVGIGSDRKLRISQAVDAIQSGAMSTTDAAKAFNVDKAAISNRTRLDRCELKLAALCATGKQVAISEHVKLAMAGIQADSVLQSSIELAQTKGANSKDVATTIREAVLLPTESQQLEHIKLAAISVSESPTINVRKPIRAEFLRSLSTLEKVLSKHTTLDALEISSDMRKEITERCRVLTSMLKSL